MDSLDSILQFIALVAIIIGTFFSIVGVLGYLRFPDVYAKLHAAGKVGVFGVVLLLVAAVVWTPLGWAKGGLLIVFLMISGPVATHAIGSAAFRIGIPMKNSDRDDLNRANSKE